MKRTTISRSSLALLAALLAAPAAGAAAQDTLQTGTQERRHVVREGETLWAIAQMYLGDPFLWPTIYRLNTLVVEDPHWIFPGEELRLVPPDTTMVAVTPPAAAPADTAQVAERPPVAETPPVEAPPMDAPAAAPPPPPPAAEAGRTVFFRQTRNEAGPALLPFASTMPSLPVRRGQFYGAGFLTEGEHLPWAEVRGAVRDGEVVSGRTEVSSAIIFERVRIRAPAGATYHVGDSLLTARLQRDIGGGWGWIVLPTGIVRVVFVSGRDVLAEVITQFSRVADGQVAMPVEPFRNPGAVRPQPVDEGVRGRVVAIRDAHPVPIQQDVVFIDLGRNDGIVPGDVFEVIRPAEEAVIRDQPPDRLAVLHIVHVRDRSASGLLTQIAAPGTDAGVPVRLIRKMPS